MKKALFIALLLLTLPGCALLENPLFWRLTLGGVIRAAYNSGGAEAVEYKIDELTHQGTIDPEQAEKIKDAAQQGYDKLTDSLLETETEDIPLEG